MSAFDTHSESPSEESATLESQRLLKAAGDKDLDFESQRLRNRLRARMFGVDAAPITIGRFAVLETVGSGGMGVVYAAYDQQLDRRVAVKLLRSARGEDASVGKGRLLREAQALAKLSHPNVVQIYEVGTFDDRVFLAMEFLSGDTLRSWLLDGPHPWPQTLQHFMEAGRGLAAAHREGIIHRDFKPANLLLGADGRVRVVDFGLARAAERTRFPEAERESGDELLSVELTQTGEIMGTPAYMSPEQARHDPVDARSDQYSFCASLYEALFGRRPHRGRSTAEVLLAVTEGHVQPPPRNAKVPNRIVRAVMRGLSTHPAQRFPSMDELLAELSTVRRGLRWRVFGGGAVIAAGVSALLLSADAPCPDFSDAIGDAWSGARQAQVEAAFANSAVPGAAEVQGRIHEGLQDYAEHWTATRLDACEAHHVRQEQSAQMHDLRVACLLERRAELGALTAVFAEADPRSIRQASRAVLELSSVAECDEPNHARAEALLDPVRRELRVALAQAKAEYKAGRYDLALTMAADVARHAREQDVADMEAAALLGEGFIQSRAKAYPAALELFEQTVDVAEAAGSDEVGASAWTELARRHAFVGNNDVAERCIQRAAAKLRRLGEPAELALDLGAARAYVARWAKRFDEAIELQQAAVDGYSEQLGPLHPKTTDALLSLANMLGTAGRHDEAQQHYTEARATLVRIYGEDHPHVADVVVDVAIDLYSAGRVEEARERFLEGEQLIIAWAGERALALIVVNNALASIAMSDQRWEEAKRRAQKVLSLTEAEDADRGPRLDALAVLGMLAQRDFGDAEAVEYYRESLQIVARGNVASRYMEQALYTRFALVKALLFLERWDEAEHEVEELGSALSREAAIKYETIRVGLLRAQGRVALHRGRRADAVRLFEQALDHWTDSSAMSKLDRAQQACTRWNLATAVAQTDRKRARALAVSARDALIEAQPDSGQLAEINAWLEASG
ncbi:MAG: protein kinase [Deltaproteobacteria bacterium]|nr:protein kinase [Deltaproteobacteria bacterium]